MDMKHAAQWNPTTPPQPPYIACVDIGGSKVSVRLASVECDSASSFAFSPAAFSPALVRPTVKEGDAYALANQVIEMIEALCAKWQVRAHAITRIGVSTAGPLVRMEYGLGLMAPNICGGLLEASDLPNNWVQIPLQAPLQTHWKHAAVNVRIDVIAALQAERLWGALQGSAHCAYVTWSTGVGAGVCVDGTVLMGKNGNAGHVGHIFTGGVQQGVLAGAVCGCGNVEDVEAICGGRNLGLRAQELGYADAVALFTAAYAGDVQAKQTVNDATDTMSRALYNLVVLFDLDSIALGGSLFWHNQDYVLPRLQKGIRHGLPVLTDGVQLKVAGLGQEVGDYAALAVALG